VARRGGGRAEGREKRRFKETAKKGRRDGRSDGEALEAGVCAHITVPFAESKGMSPRISRRVFKKHFPPFSTAAIAVEHSQTERKQ